MGLNIMCVDDSAGVLESLNWLTVDESYRVFAFNNPIEALIAIETAEFAVVVVEHRMKIMNGLEFLKRVKDRSPGTAGILIADYINIDVGTDAIFQEYIYRLIRKPYDILKIKSAVNSGIARYEIMAGMKEWDAVELKKENISTLSNSFYSATNFFSSLFQHL